MSKPGEIAEGWMNVIFRKHEIERISQTRMNICNTCEHHSKFHDTIRIDVHCTKCGCPLVSKTRSTQSECPIGKWLAVKPKSS